MAFFGQNTSVLRVYVKPVTHDKLQKYIRIPDGALIWFSAMITGHFLFTNKKKNHVFRVAATEMEEEKTVLGSQLCTVYFFVSNDRNTIMTDGV